MMLIKMNKIHLLFCFSVCAMLTSCTDNTSSIAAPENTSLPSVSLVQPIRADIQENMEINGQVVYLNKATVSAPITGFVTFVNVKLGDQIKEGSLLYKLQTKESRALQNDTATVGEQFGIVEVFSTTSGFVSSILVQDTGIYMAESNPLLTISKNQDLLIQVNTPFQYAKWLRPGASFMVHLPDGNSIASIYSHAIPTVDPISQTQQIYLRLKNYSPLPENLNVRVAIPTNKKQNVLQLPEEAILTNEVQSEFWVMRMNADSLAIRTPITKGIEMDRTVEIVAPELTLTDNIILSGAYGLQDSTKVKVD